MSTTRGRERRGDRGLSHRGPARARAHVVAALFLVTAGQGAGVSAGDGPLRPDLGEPVSGAAVAALDVSVFPDGRGLPPGSGSAVDGVDAYVAKCASCHGLRGEGKPSPALVGGLGSLGTAKPVKTVGSFWPYATTLFDYIRRAMPYDRPMSLTDAETYGITAYILWRNGIIDSDFVLDARTLPEVRMPNGAGFVDAWEADRSR